MRPSSPKGTAKQGPRGTDLLQGHGQRLNVSRLPVIQSEVADYLRPLTTKWINKLLDTLALQGAHPQLHCRQQAVPEAHKQQTP
jgi:hypothetical protein